MIVVRVVVVGVVIGVYSIVSFVFAIPRAVEVVVLRWHETY